MNHYTFRDPRAAAFIGLLIVAIINGILAALVLSTVLKPWEEARGSALKGDTNSITLGGHVSDGDFVVP